MESSDSEDEGDGAESLGGSQTDRLLREEDFFRFVNNLTVEDYKLMRDNNLLGIPGESTEEELLRRLQLLKEDAPQNTDENTGGGDSSDDVSSGDSLRDWLNSVTQTEHVSGEQRENQSWRAVTQIDPNSEYSKINSERNANHIAESWSRENEYAPSPRLHGTENAEDSQSQMENSPCESIYTKPFRCEQSTNVSLLDILPTKGQRRARSRSPDHRRTRARPDGRSPSDLLIEITEGFPHGIRPWNFHDLRGNEIERYSTTQHQETSRQPVTTPELQNRGSSVTSEIGNVTQDEYSSDSDSIGDPWGSRLMNSAILSDTEEGRVPSRENYQEDSIVSRTQLTSERPNNAETLESEKGRLSRMFSHSEQADRIAYDNTNRLSLHRLLSSCCSDATSSAIQNTSEQTMTGFSDSSNHMDTTNRLSPHRFLCSCCSDTSAIQNTLEQTMTVFTDSSNLKGSTNRLSLHRFLCSCCSDATSSAIQNTSEQTMTGFSDSSNHMGSTNRLSHHRLLNSCCSDTTSAIQITSEQTMAGFIDSDNHMGTTSRLSLHRFLCSCCSDTTSSAIQNTSEQTMTGFSDSSNHMDSDSNLEPNVSAPSPGIERTSSPNGRDGSGNSTSDINAIPRIYFHPCSPSVSRSSSNYAPSSSSTPISSSSSSDNISVISSQLFEGNDERSISGLSEYTIGSRPMSPVMFDDGDSWTSLNLDHFFLLEEDQHQSTGLTKVQIDNLAIRSFGETDALKPCSICITEFTEGNKILTLPCTHEYHVHCIDRWLSENTTCPICRREVVDPAERENSN
ncbi:E3 ubiquitin-protein ligase RLIM-like [Talpa occidentalis]|uniref:E3 ubiquitin-protein ligase RLIM-like n=1 Tax=Talpa occidentalis TaxID=50954 RepID=UPI00188FA538|nr:E3 ubiquitin-protein ligase RLIM-like [Talpa occidentalis]